MSRISRDIDYHEYHDPQYKISSENAYFSDHFQIYHRLVIIKLIPTDLEQTPVMIVVFNHLAALLVTFRVSSLVAKKT